MTQNREQGAAPNSASLSYRPTQCEFLCVYCADKLDKELSMPGSFAEAAVAWTDLAPDILKVIVTAAVRRRSADRGAGHGHPRKPPQPGQRPKDRRRLDPYSEAIVTAAGELPVWNNGAKLD